MIINLTLILYKTWIQKKFPLSVFVFIDCLVVSASQDAVGYAISRTVERVVYGHVITTFSRMGSLSHFLTHGAPLRARELC